MVMSTNSSASSMSSMVVCLCVPFSGSFLDACFVVEALAAVTEGTAVAAVFFLVSAAVAVASLFAVLIVFFCFAFSGSPLVLALVDSLHLQGP